LPLRKTANLLCSGFERIAQRWIKRFPSRGHFSRSHSQRLSAPESVELRCVAQHGFVAAFADIGHDSTDDGQHGIERRATSTLKRSQNFGCLCRASSFSSDQLHFDLPL
jgi:hypothetical protein